ncbi:MAG: beta-galactosidase [Victivallales bacterium]|jgi:hypothetical protein
MLKKSRQSDLKFSTRKQIAAHACLAISTLFMGIAISAADKTPAGIKPLGGMTELRRIDLPDAPLRGYGSLGGEYVEYGTAGAAASVLRISCADAEKAKITLGKYLSDLRSLKGVKDSPLAIEGKNIPLTVVEGRGAILALRQDKTVVVVTAPCAEDIGPLLKSLNIALRADSDFSGAAVPTFMDKFDRWGFGFWFNPPMKTPDKQEDTYDVRQKFEWAKKMGVGLQIDVHLNRSVGAYGILDDTGKRWAVELARDMGIPASIQMQGDAAPQWIANRYGEQMQRKVPQYVGSWYGINGNNGFPGSPYNQLSWASVDGKDRLFNDLYKAVGKYKAYPNVTGYGEWHGEIGEGPVAMMMDYGPAADARYRDFLKEKYKTVKAVDQRWSGGKGLINDWDKVRMPEPAEFLGFGTQAVDLQGEWRTCLEEKLPADAKDKWGEPELKDDDWRRLMAPGDDRQIYREKWRVPSIFRRSFNLTAEQLKQLKANGKTYLYAWTLQQGNNTPVRVFINGKRLPDQTQRCWASWVAFEVGDTLKAGGNHMALSLPWGELSYRLYLSPDAPRCYPDLGKEKNSQWVDYRDFMAWMREDCLRRSLESIRREDSDKFIKLYAPGAITDIMKGLAEDYGCFFHDTGGMSGNWNDSLPSLMRSSGLPMSLEPGNPAYDMKSLRIFFGHWATEGLNAVDYFMDIGDILWRPDQKAWFEAHLPLVHLLGKFHYPNAEIAVMSGARAHRLTGFPWDGFDTPLLWNWRRNGVGTLSRIPNPRDCINESDFMRGNVGKYKVVVDDATLIMDDALVVKIEEWVKAGGIFITQGQSGRHTPETPDAWPMNRLTGYKSVGNNDNWRVGPVDGQPIFTDPLWSKRDANGPVLGGAGVLMEKVAPDCQDILKWPNGAIAMGVRQLGKGKVIAMGSPMPNVATGWTELFKWCGVNVSPAPVAQDCRTARFVSNNGLYDVYVVWAEKIKEPGTITLTVPGKQTLMRDVYTGATVTGVVKDDKVEFAGLKVEPMETYAFFAARQSLAAAPFDWLKLQREWWKGTKKPAAAPKFKPWPYALDLDADWAFMSVPADKDPLTLVNADVNDKTWPRMDFGVWYGTKYPDTKCGVFRNRFTAPAAWQGKGRTWLWMRNSTPVTFLPPYKTQVYLDGQPIYDTKGWKYASCVQEITERLTPGEHLLTVVSRSTNPVGGIDGNIWLEHLPEPAARQSLDGDWNGVQLPGKVKTTAEIKRSFKPDPAMKKKKAYLYLEFTENNIMGIILNGRIMSRDQGGQHFLLELSSFWNWDQQNAITLNLQYPQHPVAIKTVEIRYYDVNQL